MENVEVITKGATGPKRKYDASMCNTIIDVATSGGHVSEMMMAIGVRSKDTFFRWQKEYPEFKEAYEYSKIVSQAFYERMLLNGSLGQIPGFNATAFAMIMNNKFGDEYKRSATGSNTEITINSMSLTSDQMNLKIAQKMEQLKALGIELAPTGEEDNE